MDDKKIESDFDDKISKKPNGGFPPIYFCKEKETYKKIYVSTKNAVPINDILNKQLKTKFI